ncbi:MAG: histidine phosphatase family protein [Liquorilactobacillus hordei]|uniref:histidine phosphatase family protein n=1 Tax=Liquorilactobacillus hordei TaxID=468911 RepID=UPI001CC0F942|nr:histidine phosphatase family protein [Liquorilactobacillus hordei]MBZ2406330.1 histidine phosphatase family protein [Liquorilactobacillus hordei]
MVFTIYFVRHGQTIFNHYNRMQGWCDSPLTEKGISDAHKAGKRLAAKHFTNVYHSDTSRAKNTCHIIMDENNNSTSLSEPTILPQFREQGYGYFEGNDSSQTWLMVGASRNCRSFSEIISNYSIEDSRDFMKEIDPFQDAESNDEFWKRVNSGFDYIRNHQKDGDEVLVVSHGTTIRSIVHRFAPDIDIVSLSPQNGSVTKMIVSDDSVSVEYFNHYKDEQSY